MRGIDDDVIGVEWKIEGSELVGGKCPATPAGVTVNGIRFFGGLDVNMRFGFKIRDGKSFEEGTAFGPGGARGLVTGGRFSAGFCCVYDMLRV